MLTGPGAGGGMENKLGQVVKFYTAVKRLAETRLTDGAGKKPTYSLRTLCRALIIRYTHTLKREKGARAMNQVQCAASLLKIL